MQADLCFKLGEKKRSIRILKELRVKLLNTNGQPIDYRSLANNYKTTADVLRAMGKLSESSEFCVKVFEL